MQVHVTELRYWKSEHNAETNEDAVCFNAAAGLFAVADGVGSASFSDIWANILVRQFVAVPLMSNDPFEVEWWLRRAQAEYEQCSPKIENLPSFAREKAREGSQSTLVTLRVERIESKQATARLLGFGDSCAFVYYATTNEVEPFPITQCGDFDRPPICLPSRLSEFDYDFHRGQARVISLVPGDIVILATDAVARWLWCDETKQGGSALRAFQEIVSIPDIRSWAEFVNTLRSDYTMRDDDTTVLIICVTDDEKAQKLGYTPRLPDAVVLERRQALAEARNRRLGVEVAVNYGDGLWLGEDDRVPEEEVAHARRVAIARSKIIKAIRKALRTHQDIKTIVEPIWRQYEDLLWDEPSAEQLRRTLADLGIFIKAIPSREERALARLHRALATDDDVQIAEEIQRLQKEGISLEGNGYSALTAVERERIDLVLRRLKSLECLREALASNDDQRIVGSYDTILDHSPLISSEERQRIILAQERIERYTALTEALSNKVDDFTIVQRAHPFLLDYSALSADQFTQICHALRRYEHLWTAMQAVRERDSRTLAKVMHLYHGIIPEQWTHILLQDQQERLQNALETFGSQEPIWQRVLAKCKAIVMKVVKNQKEL